MEIFIGGLFCTDTEKSKMGHLYTPLLINLKKKKDVLGKLLKCKNMIEIVFIKKNISIIFLHFSNF